LALATPSATLPPFGGVVGRFVRDDDHLRAGRMLVAPAVRDVKQVAARDEGPAGSEQVAKDRRARRVDMEGLQRLARVLDRDVTGLVPVEQLAGIVVGSGDEAIQRHRHVGEDLAHGEPPVVVRIVGRPTP
jgi:hypothetical protein